MKPHYAVLTAAAILGACSDVGPGFAGHPVDCAAGFAWADCAPGTAGYKPTQAQVAYQMRKNGVVSDYQACMATARATSEYALLARHQRVVPPDSRPTLDQLASTELATSEEVAAFRVVYAAQRTCSTTAVAAAANPRLTTLYPTFWDKEDATALDLMQRRSTWGQYEQRVTTIKNEFNAQLTETSHAAAQSEQAEQDRKAALMGTFMEMQSTSKPVNCLSNAVGRTVYTTCN